jgi:hypothetical protein
MATMDLPTTDRQKLAIQQTVILVAFGLLLNVAFFFLSRMYYEDKQLGLAISLDDSIGRARLSFGIFTLFVVASLGAHLFLARWTAHATALLLAAVSLVAAVAASRAEMTETLPAALGLGGIIIPLLVWRSLVGSRVAWAFLVSMCVTLAVVTMFAAPKIASLFHVNMWLAMTLPGLFATTASGLIKISDRYREQVF